MLRTGRRRARDRVRGRRADVRRLIQGHAKVVSVADAAEATKRVLIVDDDPDIAKVIGVLVRHCGYETCIAHDGATSLDAARNFRPHVVLLDIGLPDISGYDLAPRLRSEADLNQALLIALTGYGQEEDRRMAMESGFDIHLVKPVTLDALQDALGQSRGR